MLPLLHQAELTAGFYRSNGHDRYDAFTVFVRNMNQVELSSYDQAVEDEAQTVSIGSGAGAHSLQTA